MDYNMTARASEELKYSSYMHYGARNEYDICGRAKASKELYERSEARQREGGALTRYKASFPVYKVGRDCNTLHASKERERREQEASETKEATRGWKIEMNSSPVGVLDDKTVDVEILVGRCIFGMRLPRPLPKILDELAIS